MIYPEVFNGYALGFFTDRHIGVDVGQLTGMSVYMPEQRHTGRVMVLGKSDAKRAADSVITNRRCILIGVKTADCVPILLCDKSKNIIAAVHAGWRGTAEGILKNTIMRMQKEFGSKPQQIAVAIGPSIKGCCYEVKENVSDAVSAQTGKGGYYRKQRGRMYLDLQEANALQAVAVGIIRSGNISIIEECTCCNIDRYYSYRCEKGTEGRQGGFISLP